MEIEDSLKARALSVTDYIFEIPTYKRSAVYLLIASLVTGFFLSFLVFREPISFESLSNSLLYGGSQGIFLLGIPAFIAAVLAASVSRKETFRQRLKHFLFLSLVSTLVTSILYTIGLLLSPRFADIGTFVLVANALLFIVWFLSSLIILNFGGARSILVSLVHPLLNLSFLVIYKSYLLASVNDPALIALQFLGACVVLLFAVEALFYLINAPAKSNFGISTMQAATMFFAQWVYGTKGLEDVLAIMSEEVETFMGAVAFRRVGSKSTKASFLVPYIHFGPFGNLGGSEFPQLIAKDVEKRTGGAAFVFHSTSNHDLNPVYSSEAKLLSDEFTRQIKSFSSRDYSKSASIVHATHNTARVLGLSFGRDNKGFFAISRAPKTTDDIELAVGLVYMNKLKSLGYGEAILADMHNSKGDKSVYPVGGEEFYDYYDLLDKLKAKQDGKAFKLGTAFDALLDFTPAQGIAAGGAKVAIFESGAKRMCFVLVDANNVHPPYRRELLLHLNAKYKFDYCDVMTTDTHAVNTISGVHNPLGATCDTALLTSKLDAAVSRAILDLEPCEAAASMKRIKLEVLGSKRSLEVVSTVNSIISIAKIVGPLVLILSIAAAFFLLIFVIR